MTDEELAVPSRPGVVRRPTDHELSLRPHLTRKPSDLLPPPMHQGQFTPELSPLDAFVSRGRLLYRQLEQEDRQRKTSEQSQSPTPPKSQHLQPQPPKFSRSHSAGAETEVGVESLSAAVEEWATGTPIGVDGKDRSTKLFQHPVSRPQHVQPRELSPPRMPFSKQPKPQSPVRAEVPRPKQAFPQVLNIQEPTFRPVSSQVRISGFDFAGDRSSTISQQTIPNTRGISIPRGIASPRSPRMPFSEDETSEEEVNSFSRVQGVRRDLARGRGTGPTIFVGARDEHSPVSLKDEDGYRRSIEDQISPMNGVDMVIPSPNFSVRSDSRGSTIDFGHGREGSRDSTVTVKASTRPQQPLTPPSSTSPVELSIDRSKLPKRQSSLQANLGVPYLAQAASSTPNLPFISHHSSGSSSSLAPQQRPVQDDPNAVLLNGELFLPPQPAFAARSAPSSPRPSSAMSDTASIYTIGGSRKNFNFSRPMSKQSFSSLDGDLSQLKDMKSDVHRSRRQDSVDHRFEFGGDNHDEADHDFRKSSFSQTHKPQMSGSGQVGAVDSYTYAQYNLPRGREPTRESVIFFDGERRKFKYDSDGNKLIRQNSDDSNKSSNSTTQPNPSPFAAIRASSESQDRPSLPIPRPDMLPVRNNSSASTATTSTSVHRPSTAGAHRLTPQEHLDLGISLHEKGSNAESTYHFRLSAMGNNPSGMLMYGLALRHGWGMRSNPAEAVSWLRRAADIVQTDLATSPDAKEIKTKLALAVYELGMSCSNGWGVPVDKKMALQYFELAASWGDCDALSEAGFAYANGAGCKKDLKKSATYYRAAAAKGVSMVGNSWIWKDKYSEEGEGDVKTSRERSKSVVEKRRPSNEREKPGPNIHQHPLHSQKEKAEKGGLFGRKK